MNLPISAEANVSEAKVKPQSGGHSQNGQAVEYGNLLFIIG
ncbi:MAG: hypothetical protein FD134_2514 [Gallionellaceae bacterium]|nr:MAG: hypothetical protein FD134_2514 [Gallionellaceae bacterium]